MRRIYESNFEVAISLSQLNLNKRLKLNIYLEKKRKSYNDCEIIHNFSPYMYESKIKVKLIIIKFLHLEKKKLDGVYGKVFF